MTEKVVWLFVFVALYWAYCIYWGVRGAMTARTASDYFIAGRRLSMIVFILAATATSFSGWTFMGHPGLVYRDGFQYAYASFYAITIPFTGVIFLKRQWMLGKRYGFVTPGEMLADYFKGDAIRILTVVVALFFSVPYLGLQLRASGFLFNVLTDGYLAINTGMWVLSIIVFLYVASGGLRAVGNRSIRVSPNWRRRISVNGARRKAMAVAITTPISPYRASYSSPPVSVRKRRLAGCGPASCV